METTEYKHLATSSRQAERAIALARWERFALGHAARTAPHPAPHALAASARAACYRLRLSHLEALPLFQGPDRNFELRLGLTLWDSSAACFFGPTMRGPAVAYDMRKSRGKRGFRVDLDLPVYLHTRAPVLASDPAAAPLAAIAELVLVERAEDGVVVGEYSAGWASIPLHLPTGAESYPPLQPSDGSGSVFAAPGSAPTSPQAAGAPASPARDPVSWAASAALPLGSPLGSRRGSTAAGLATVAAWQSGMTAAAFGGGGVPGRPVMHCVSVVVGSPRYLLLAREMPEGACPPPPLLAAEGAECRLHYLFEAWPEMEAWSALAPQDALLCTRDALPGLLRLDPGSGLPTRRFVGATTQLSPAGVGPVLAVQLSGLTLRLPDGFLEVARRALLPPGHGHPGSSGPPPLRELQQCLRIRATVHNGRRFVGPPAVARPGTLRVVERGQHVLALSGDLPLAWLPSDDLVAIVLELFYRPCRTLAAAGGMASSSSGGSRNLLKHSPGLGGSNSNGGSSSSGSSGSATAAAHSEPPCTMLAWGAFMPLEAGPDGELRVTEGQQQAVLRSGPGRWVRPQPVLDWRRLLERTNRLSPAPPVANFELHHAEGQCIWPPPPSASGVSLAICRRPRGPALAVEGEIRAHRGSGTEQGQQQEQARRRSRKLSDGETAAGTSAKAAALPPSLRPHKAVPGLQVPAEAQVWAIQAHHTEAALPQTAAAQAQPPAPATTSRLEASVQAAEAGADESTQSPGGDPVGCREPTICLRLRAASCPRLVRAYPALDEAGPVAAELAASMAEDGVRMVTNASPPHSVRQSVEARAARKVRLLLEQEGHLASPARADGSNGNGNAGPEEVLLVQQCVLGDVEVARERCKRDQILRQLQAQADAVVASRDGSSPAPCPAGCPDGSRCEKKPLPGSDVARSLWQELQRMKAPAIPSAAAAAAVAAATPATIVAVTRCFEVMLPPGCSSLSKKVRWTNWQSRPVRLHLHSHCPTLVCLSSPTLALASGESGHIRLTIEAAGLEGQRERAALVFVGEENGGSGSECFKVMVRRAA